MSDHDELIQQFTAVSGADADRAKFFLESAAWNLSTALSSFFEEGGEEASGSDGATAAAATNEAAVPPPGRAGSGPASNWIEDDSDEDLDEDDEDDGGQAFYAGGSQHSGQQVLGPPRKKKDAIAKLFKAVKQQGAEVVTGHRDERSERAGGAAFRGTSYRLGETADDSEVIPDQAAREGSRSQTVELRMWRTGFTVDDGPLREYQDPQNQTFLAEIKAGRIPMELLRASGGKQVIINMSDRHHEDYAAPKPRVKAFTGQGQTLGSPAPSVVGQVSSVPGPGGSSRKPPAAALEDPKQLEEEAKKQLSVDTDKPTTNVQVRLGDGSRLVVRANHTHTVADLRTYVTTARPQYLEQDFALMTTFPHAELADYAQTLSAANILNAAIVVKSK